jgi:taurine dioxygenase
MRLAAMEQVGLTRLLGEIEPASDQRNHHSDSTDVLVVHNTGDTPVVGNQHWHSDRSFHLRPSRYTVLYGELIGHGGGETLFADMVAAHRQAPSSWKTGLAEAVGVHSYDKLARLRAEVHDQPIQADYATLFPPVRHPVVRAHPESGTPAFYLSELCLARIESEAGVPSDISVEELHAHATQDRFVYRHQWRPEDVVIWDNARVMHRAAQLPAGSQRVLHRTTTAGDPPQPAEPMAADGR